MASGGAGRVLCRLVGESTGRGRGAGGCEEVPGNLLTLALTLQIGVTTAARPQIACMHPSHI